MLEGRAATLKDLDRVEELAMKFNESPELECQGAVRVGCSLENGAEEHSTMAGSRASPGQTAPGAAERPQQLLGPGRAEGSQGHQSADQDQAL